MKILSVATTHPRFPRDSEPAFVFYLNRELVRLGHEVTTLVPHAAGSKRDEVVDGVRIRRFRYFWPESWQRLCYEGGTLPNLGSSWIARANLPFFLAAQAVNLTKELHHGSYDLVHAHWLLPQGFLSASLGRACGVPVVITAHGSDINVDSRVFRAVNRMALKLCRLCTAVSEPIEEEIRRLNPLVPTKVIPMGVDTTAFRPERRSQELRGLLGGNPLLLFVGRLAAKKGVSYLVRAMPEIVRHSPTAMLAIIGGGPEETALREEISQLKLGQHVALLGKMRQDEIPRYMASADLFVLPSESEGLPVVLMEALASGTPVLSTNVGGISQLIRAGETGLFTRQRDPEDIARQCLAILDSEELRKTIIHNGLELTKSSYCWPNVARSFETVFEAQLRTRHYLST